VTGFVWFVGAGPGDPDLITLRGWRALQRADVVLYDSLLSPELLDASDAERVFVGKRCGRHAMPQPHIGDLLVHHATRGRRVVRLKGGDPGVLGRVGEEALQLTERGVPFEIVPGVSSATAVPEVAGIPVTHRGLADAFVVATAHRREGVHALSLPDYRPRTTLVLLMARAGAESWGRQLLLRGYPPELPVALVSQGCTERQRVVVTRVADAARDLLASQLETPLLAVVGQVVRLRARLCDEAAIRPVAGAVDLESAAAVPGVWSPGSRASLG
jgi:uroporphyrin-III C-methyltransferase